MVGRLYKDSKGAIALFPPLFAHPLDVFRYTVYRYLAIEYNVGNKCEKRTAIVNIHSRFELSNHSHIKITGKVGLAVSEQDRSWLRDYVAVSRTGIRLKEM